MSTERMGALSGALFLFGLAWLFLTNFFWPGIMYLVWLTAIPTLIAENGWGKGLWLSAQAGIYLIGLPWQFIVGPRGVKTGVVELKNRGSGEREELSIDSALSRLVG